MQEALVKITVHYQLLTHYNTQLVSVIEDYLNQSNRIETANVDGIRENYGAIYAIHKILLIKK